MNGTLQEAGYGMIIIGGTALALVATMLGLFVTPFLATGLASGLVVVGTIALVPRKAWFSAGIIGVSAVVLAGMLVPRVMLERTAPGLMMPLTLSVSIIVVVAAVTTLHYVTFQPRVA